MRDDLDEWLDGVKATVWMELGIRVQDQKYGQIYSQILSFAITTHEREVPGPISAEEGNPKPLIAGRLRRHDVKWKSCEN